MQVTKETSQEYMYVHKTPPISSLVYIHVHSRGVCVNVAHYNRPQMFATNYVLKLGSIMSAVSARPAPTWSR